MTTAVWIVCLFIAQIKDKDDGKYVDLSESVYAAMPPPPAVILFFASTF